ncbi:MAG: hypothetical protein ACLU5J_07645 [Christensenellales bacterium]
MWINGDNARAGLIARALVEMKRIVVAMGGKEDTIYGLTGEVLQVEEAESVNLSNT